MYNHAHPRQKSITESIIKDLIISCNPPLTFVKNPSFRKFLSVADEKYCPISRSTVTRRISDQAAEKEADIKSRLQKADIVSVTVDIWTDKTMRGFLGVTAYFMDLKSEISPRLQSVLLSCDRFTGSHTGERISDKFEQVCEKSEVKHNLQQRQLNF